MCRGEKCCIFPVPNYTFGGNVRKVTSNSGQLGKLRRALGTCRTARNGSCRGDDQGIYEGVKLSILTSLQNYSNFLFFSDPEKCLQLWFDEPPLKRRRLA